MENAKNNTMIQSLQVGMSIIDLIAIQENPLKFTEIQELTSITKSNLYKYLNTLTHLGLLERDKKNGTYSLGSKMIEYGMAAIGNQDIISKVTPYLQEISLHTSFSALFAVWTNDGPVIANIWSSNNGLNIGANIGTRLPIQSSSGKIFSVFNPPNLTKEWKDKELAVLTDKERTYLLNDEGLIEENFISFAKEPLVPYVSSLSTPIFNYNKELIGAITVVGFSQLISQDLNDDLSQYLLSMSNQVSKRFGYKRPV
ncbi:IclR family transcriptional regulator [Metabacillus sediminilitoris]|uniref:IclR family transcriptional regulator n=1 Tax=Metabacillus sediminilitoris TaxID=2567941 RepID=A0A4S4BLI5_9BACI|nr:IclR family transcriptional regulator [Metabacillus sediminilitoris]QGQ44049.1 helix-turn-helix domain-containing protein [Metabacillus sediminilitoris]THF75437.1 IclR family transcriptional regulator [Metabacillus sediminilitoris]